QKKNCVTRFIAIFALLQWSGTEPAISPRYACTAISFNRNSAYLDRSSYSVFWNSPTM
uniref:Uncharacterized protein n=1 Tax=Apteryx owenii TaxID=8824 RepID=A0A8B9SAC8_APTOW